jgi:hypothetical protein
MHRHIIFIIIYSPLRQKQKDESENGLEGNDPSAQIPDMKVVKRSRDEKRATAKLHSDIISFQSYLD